MIDVWLGPLEGRKGDVLLAQVLGGYLGCDPGRLVFRREPGGKPVLDDAPGGQRPHFSLSHSRDRWAVVVSELGPVGIDLELRDTNRPLQRLVRRFFTEGEWQQWQQLAEASRPSYFFDCWTLKEALVKAAGGAMATTMGKVGFRPVADGIRYIEGGVPADGRGRAFFLAEPAPEWHLAICLESVAGALPRVRFHDWESGALDLQPRARGKGLAENL